MESNPFNLKLLKEKPKDYLNTEEFSSFLNKNKHTGVFLKWLQILVFLAIAAFILVP
mgnify:CR=1 FL=1